MRNLALSAMTVSCLVAAAPAAAADIAAETAIRKYCEPLVLGGAAAPVKDLARADGLKDAVVAGQPVLRQGELLVALSDSPRVCFVQAPEAMTLAQGLALADDWARRFPGAIRGPGDRGPDGAPARAWSVPARKIALIATQQPAATGGKVMNFILMPLPTPPARR